MVDRRPHGGNAPEECLDFSASINPLGPPAAIQRILQENLELNRYPYGPRETLRQKIADKTSLAEGNVLLGAGTAGLIQLLFGTLDAGVLSVAVPTFTEYEDLARANGWTVRTAPVHPPLEAAGSVSFEESDAVAVCNPNNPSGTLCSAETLREWVNRAEFTNTDLIVDEAFMPFTDDPGDHSLIEEVGSSDRLIVLRSFTKFYGIPGLRVGYLLASEEVAERLRSVQNPWPVGEPALRAAEHALDVDRFAEDSREVLGGERNRVRNELNNIDSLRTINTDVNFLLFYSPVENLNEKLLKRSMYLRDASTFTGLGSGWYRLGLKNREANDALIETLRVLHRDRSRV